MGSRSIWRATLVTLVLASCGSLVGESARAATGDLLRSFDVADGPCQQGDVPWGRGMAFDGSALHYTIVGSTLIYKISVTGACLGAIEPAGGVSSGGPLAWDGSALWTINYASDSFTLLRVHPGTGAILSSCNIETQNPAHPAVTSTPNIGFFPDGLDFANGTLWLSSDANPAPNWVVQVDTACNILSAFQPAVDGFGWGTSGVEFDGSYLWHVYPQSDQFVQTNLSGMPTGVSFSSSLGGFEDLACDPATFPGKAALWARHSFSKIAAFEIPECGGEPLCGDGDLDPGEDCDDGNVWDGDGCSSSCRGECVSNLVGGSVACAIKLFQNTTGAAVNDVEWLIAGSYSNADIHFHLDGAVEGQPNSEFSSFTVTPSGSDTLLHWSGDASIADGDYAMVGIWLKAAAIQTRAVSWTIDENFAGCVKQVRVVFPSPAQPSPDFLYFRNPSVTPPCPTVYVGDIHLEWFAAPVDFQDLTPSGVRSPMATAALGDLLTLPQSAAANVSIPPPPAGASFLMIRFTVSDNASLSGPGNTVDHMLFRMPLPVPALSNWGMALLSLLLLTAMVLRIRRRALPPG